MEKKQDKRSVLTISDISSHRNGEYRSFIFFFTILYQLHDCKMVSDQFWMIYSIAENSRPTGKTVKYTPAAWGLMQYLLHAAYSSYFVNLARVVY